MPTLDQVESLDFVKGLFLGDPGSGKTGALVSLVKAGYKLAIYDMDNLVGSLAQQVRQQCPENMGNVYVQTFTDRMQGSQTPVTMIGNSMRVLPFTSGTPDAFTRCLGQLSRWKEGETDLGDPGKLGPDWFVVIDSLTNLAQAAFRYAYAMNPAGKEGQTFYGIAQAMVLNTIQLLFSKQMGTNVLVLAHIDYRENEIEVLKGFPRTVGSALNSQIGGYFNCILRAVATGQGKNVTRVIRTNPDGIVDLKNPVSFKVENELPLNSGLATFVEAVTGRKPS